MGTFGVKRVSDENFVPSMILYKKLLEKGLFP